jgi:hypothetical protein
VTPQQAATLVDQVVVALERGDTSSARRRGVADD